MTKIKEKDMKTHYHDGSITACGISIVEKLQQKKNFDSSTGVSDVTCLKCLSIIERIIKKQQKISKGKKNDF